jgi:CheY-like chemotaxis protein
MNCLGIGSIGMKVPSRKVVQCLAFFVLNAPAMLNAAKKILIADSDDNFRESLRSFINGLGYEVSEATTGVEAVEKASNSRPDLIIMDVCLPGLSGDEVTRQLKRNLSTRHIPVVIGSGWTTACNVEERIDRALVAGASEVLYKPFQMPTLRSVMRSYLFA